VAAPRGAADAHDGAGRGTDPRRCGIESETRGEVLKVSESAQRPSRPLEFPNLLNARDLGGYPTKDGAHTRWRSLLRADDLSQLSAEGLQALAGYGVRTVLDLRWPEEAARHPSPVPAGLPQLHYQRISLLTHTEDEWRLRSRDAAKELWKCAVLEHVRSELRHVLSFIAAAPPEALLFHCVAGKDRTGLVAALLLALADVTPEAIAQDYAVSAENLREGYLKRYADTEPARILDALRCPEEGAHNMLRFLERAGGVRTYLAQIGLTPPEIARLRARLRS
jgi:protein-tyrosine phosphatase